MHLTRRTIGPLVLSALYGAALGFLFYLWRENANAIWLCTVGAVVHHSVRSRSSAQTSAITDRIGT